MPASTRSLRRPRPRTILVAGALALAAVAAGCVPAPSSAPPPPPPPPVCEPPVSSTAIAVAVMGDCPRVSVDQIVAWFEKKSVSPYKASVPLRELVTLFVEEGQAEGVRGDLAFIQSIIETGWFAFPGRVPPWANNFSGFGATDGTNDFGVFRDARTGVRAQIQHLRAYADATATKCATPPLQHPCEDSRFGYVTPKGKAPTWNQFGNGVWATDPTYATKILNLYANLLQSTGLGLA